MYRIPMRQLMFLGSCVFGAACGGTRPLPTAPSPSAEAQLQTRNGGVVASVSASPRSGAVYITKECSTYTGQAGEMCTITSSTLKDIEVGSRVTYAKAAAGGSLDTDVLLDPPGPGNNHAFGHCTLSLATGIGTCTFSGGTGKFTWLSATVAISPLGGGNFAWTGSYSFSPRD